MPVRARDGREPNRKMATDNLKKCEKKCFKIQYVVYKTINNTIFSIPCGLQII